MGRLILLFVGANVAAVLQMAWGFAFWMYTPIPYDYMMQQLPPEQDAQILKALQDAKVDSGHYFYPWAPKNVLTGQDAEGQKAFMQKHAEGPLVEIIYQKNGLGDTGGMLTYLYGYLQLLGCSLLAGLMLMLAGRGLPSYFRRVLFLILLAVFAPAAIVLASPIWWHHPWRYALAYAGFQLVLWLIAAIVLAAFVWPPKPKAAIASTGTRPSLMPEDFSPSDRVRL